VLREVFGGAARFAADPATLAGELVTAAAVADPACRVAGRALAARHAWDAAARVHLRLHRSPA
jgi:hypothetical protein